MELLALTEKNIKIFDVERKDLNIKYKKIIQFLLII